MNTGELKEIAKNIRTTILKEVHAAGSGHPGGSLSAAEIMTVLYFDEMNINPSEPKMESRDRFVLSKGHGAPVLYAALAERGYFDKDELLTLRKLGSRFQGHPSKDKVPGVEMSTGSLGQGISAAVGMAIADKMDKKDRRVYALLGDGELQEGIVWEAFMAASHYGLSNLTAIIDWNGLQIDGKNDDVMTVKPIDEKLKSFGWEVTVIDGHNIEEIKEAFDCARKENEKPSAIIAKTHKGMGVSFMKDNPSWHGKAPNDEQFEQAIKEIGGDI